MGFDTNHCDASEAPASRLALTGKSLDHLTTAATGEKILVKSLIDGMLDLGSKLSSI